MDNLVTGIFIFAGVCLPLAVAWHSFISRYLLASVFASGNAMFLLVVLVYSEHRQIIGMHSWLLGLLFAAISLSVSLFVGVFFLFSRRGRLRSLQ